MNVIFLDIDGVIQPYSAKNRFEIDREELRQKLSNELGIDYSIYNEYDVAACAVDWDKEAVNRIRNILEKTQAKIVVSSDWRSETLPYKVRDFLAIWNLEQYWYADTTLYDKELMKDTIKRIRDESKITDYIDCRNFEILDFVFKHKEITNYIAIDDNTELSPIIGNRYIKTHNIINDEQMEKAIQTLNNKNLILKR